MTPQGLTTKQIESISEADALINIWEGAVSSGKTVASIYRWILFITATRDLPGEIVLTGRTRDSAWRNVLLPAMQMYPDTISGNLGAPFARIMGQRVHVIGASDAKAEAVLRGITCKTIYIDEVTMVPESYFKMAISRLRVTGRNGGMASKLFGATNPDNPLHWLRRDYMLRIPASEQMKKDWKVFHFRLEDNPRLPAQYIHSMKAQYTGLFYKRFIEGLWVQGEGMVWDMWDEDRFVVDISEVPAMERILAVGADYGNNHQSAGHLLGYADGKLWLLAEWAPMRTDSGILSPAAQSKSFRDWIDAQTHIWGKPEFVFVDPAALAFREQLYADGLATAPAWKSVLKGLQTIHSLFSLDKIRIVDTCVGLRNEIPGYVWGTKRDSAGGTAVVDEPVKDNDDFCDAFRYAVMSSQPQWQPLVQMIFPEQTMEVPT